MLINMGGSKLYKSTEMSEIAERIVVEKKLNYFWKAGILYAEKNAHISKYFISKFHQLSSSTSAGDDKNALALYCQHCFVLLTPDNHTIRLKPKLHINSRISKIRRQVAKGGRWCLSKENGARLKRWEDSQTKVSILCKVCNNISKFPGSKRHTTEPAHEGRRKLVAKRQVQKNMTPRMNFSQQQGQQHRINNTPFTTPTSRRPCTSPMTPNPSPSSAMRMSKLKRQKHQQLQRMLEGARQENAQNQSSPLKRFLVSL